MSLPLRQRVLMGLGATSASRRSVKMKERGDAGVGAQTVAYLIAELAILRGFIALRHWRVTLASLRGCDNPANGDSLEPP